MDLSSDKTCKGCGETKPRTDFYAHGGHSDGLSTNCKACKRKAARSNHHANRERELARSRARYHANIEEGRRKNREHGRSHAAEARDRYRRWVEQNPDRDAHGKRLRRARHKGATVCDLTLAEWNALLDRYGHRCAYCGAKPAKLEMDHVVPLSAGGQHTASNVVPACKSCNASKGQRELPKCTGRRDQSPREGDSYVTGIS